MSYDAIRSLCLIVVSVHVVSRPGEHCSFVELTPRAGPHQTTRIVALLLWLGFYFSVCGSTSDLLGGFPPPVRPPPPPRRGARRLVLLSWADKG